jgi:glutamate-1-semialdehyde 2,1-aminomutase
MEVVTKYKPENNFLKKFVNLANSKNIVLIFDECTSGFRETFGGYIKNIMLNQIWQCLVKL